MGTSTRKIGYLIAAVGVIASAALCLGMIVTHHVYRFPEGWPSELGPYLNHAWENERGLSENSEYVIPFHDQERFERAWPLVLAIRRAGGSLTLYRVGETGPDLPTRSEGPSVRVIAPTHRSRSPDQDRVDIVLVVDGQVIDLNRIPLPADTPIIDRRWPKAATRPTTGPASQPATE
jgi:hypothetical protein